MYTMVYESKKLLIRGVIMATNGKISFLEKEYIVRINQICDKVKGEGLDLDWDAKLRKIDDILKDLVSHVVNRHIEAMVVDKFSENGIEPNWVIRKLTSNVLYNLNIETLEVLVKIAAIQKFLLSNSKTTSSNRSMVYSVYQTCIYGSSLPISREITRNTHSEVCKDIEMFLERIDGNMKSLEIYNVPLDIWMLGGGGDAKFYELRENMRKVFYANVINSSKKYGNFNPGNIMENYNLQSFPSITRKLLEVGYEQHLQVTIWSMFNEMIDKYGESDDYYYDARYDWLSSKVLPENSTSRLVMDKATVSKYFNSSILMQQYLMDMIIKSIE